MIPNDLEPYYANLEILRQTADQVSKDFEQHGQEIVFSGNAASAYEELFIQIKPVLLRLSQKNHSHFLNLLYRIDVDEKAIQNHQCRVIETDYFDKLTDAVLKRELVKVITRNYFRLKNDKHS